MYLTKFHINGHTHVGANEGDEVVDLSLKVRRTRLLHVPIMERVHVLRQFPSAASGERTPVVSEHSLT